MEKGRGAGVCLGELSHMSFNFFSIPLFFLRNINLKKNLKVFHIHCASLKNLYSVTNMLLYFVTHISHALFWNESCIFVESSSGGVT